MRNNLYLGISGKPGAGKDTLASYFVNHCARFNRISLGDRIREVAMMVTGLDMSVLRDHPTKDQVLPGYNITGRELTIEIGNAIEQVVGYHTWCEMTDRVIEKDGLVNVVSPDIRTPIQADWIKNRGGLLIRIDNGEGPHQYEIENKLDDYEDWDCIITTETIFAGYDKALRFVLESIPDNRIKLVTKLE